MRYVSALATAGLSCALAASADAAISFTFQDPAGGREVTYTSAGAGSNISYAPAQAVALKVDGSADGLGVLNYSASLTMNISVGQAAPLMGVPSGLFAPISGEFIFRDFMTDAELLRGTFSSGGLVSLGGAGALLTSSSSGLNYSASGALLTALSGAGIGQLFGQFDASFTLTDISPGFSVGLDNYYTSFTANAAYTGTATVPAPGAFVLMSAAGLLATRRKR